MKLCRLVRQVLELAVPPVMLQHLGVDGILQRVPKNYVAAVVGWCRCKTTWETGNL